MPLGHCPGFVDGRRDREIAVAGAGSHPPSWRPVRRNAPGGERGRGEWWASEHAREDGSPKATTSGTSSVPLGHPPGFVDGRTDRELGVAGVGSDPPSRGLLRRNAPGGGRGRGEWWASAAHAHAREDSGPKSTLTWSADHHGVLSASTDGERSGLSRSGVQLPREGSLCTHPWRHPVRGLGVRVDSGRSSHHRPSPLDDAPNRDERPRPLLSPQAVCAAPRLLDRALIGASISQGPWQRGRRWGKSVSAESIRKPSRLPPPERLLIKSGPGRHELPGPSGPPSCVL